MNSRIEVNDYAFTINRSQILNFVGRRKKEFGMISKV